MKNKCPIAQDLMPLCIDGAASEESREWVERHVAQCPACAEVYGQMKAELPRERAAAEQAEFERSARRLRQHRRRRLLRNLLIGLICGVLLIVGGSWADRKLRGEIQYPMPLEDYRVELLRSGAGDVYAMITLQEPTRLAGLTLSITGMGNAGRWYVGMEQTLLPAYVKTAAHPQLQYIGSWMEEQGLVFYDRDEQGRELLSTVETLYQGNAAQAVPVYSRGDEIPLCSAELDEYLALEREIQALWAQQALPRPGATLSLQALRDRQEALAPHIPEWQ